MWRTGRDTASEGCPDFNETIVFRNDEAQAPTYHALANFTTIRQMAANMTRRAPGKYSTRLRRKAAECYDDFPESPVRA